MMTRSTTWIQRRLALVLFFGLLLAGVPAGADSLELAVDEPTIGLTVDEPTIGPRLAEVVATNDADDIAVVAVSLEEVANDDLLAELELLGLEAVAFDNFPVVVVRGLVDAIELVALLDGVTSMWLDAPLQQAMAESRGVMGVDTVQQDLGFDGSGVGIAVLDSGIEGTHPDLEFGSKVTQNVKVVGFQGTTYEGPLTDLAYPVEDVPDTDLTTGHGTHVAGIAAGDGTASGGRLRGVASGADLIGVGVGDAYLVTTLAGYEWILDNRAEYGIRVINNSWSDSAIPYDPEHPLNLASRAAYDDGIVVIQASGNGGQGGDTFNRYAIPDWVLSVGAVDKLGRLASYSSRGTAAYHSDVMAPGSYIAAPKAMTGVVGTPSPVDATDPANPRFLSAEEIPYYTYKNGTSMAAPHVAGLAALVLEANPALTNQQVYDLLRATARPVAGCAEVDCGHGLVDAVAAVRGALDLAVPVLVAPVAELTATPPTGEAPLTVTLDASGSTDEDGDVVAYEWDHGGDGTIDETTTDPVMVRTYDAGRHRVAVTAIDDDGLRSTPVVVEIRASDPPVAAAEAPRHAKDGEEVTFDASGSYDPDGHIVTYRFEIGDGTVVEQSDPVLVHTFDDVDYPERFHWIVTVTDDAGLVDAIDGTIRVTPQGRPE